MRKQLSRSLAGILILFCMVSLLGFRAHAASGRISYNDPSVTVGNTVSVNMTVSSDAGLGSVDATLTYDTALLEYVSGSGTSGAQVTGGSGSVKVSWFNTDNPSSISISLTFQAKATGTAKVTTSSADVYTLDEEEVSLTSKGSSAITITAPPAASSEARLSSLKVGSATLSPKFSPDTYEYTTTVPAGTKKLTISLSTQDSGATYSISGTSLSVGSNTTTITVTAADGVTKKTYTIRTTRPADPVADPEDPEETEDPQEPEEPADTPITVTVEGSVLYVAKSLEGVTLPEGFESGAYTFQETEISAAKGLGKPLILFWLTDETGANGAFYVYNETDGTFFRQTDITSGQKIYTLLPLPAGVTAPEGYAETAILIEAQEVTAWALPPEGEQPSEFVLVYAMNWNGETGFYRYDTAEQTMQRYAAEPLALAPEEENGDEERELLLAQNQELQTALNRAEEQVHNSKLLVLVLGGAAAVLLVLLICVLIFTNVRRRRPPTDHYQGQRSGIRGGETHPAQSRPEPEDDDFDFDFDF